MRAERCMARIWACALIRLARRIRSCSCPSLNRRISSSSVHRSPCSVGHSGPWRSRARAAASQPSSRAARPLCVPNGYQTQRLFSSRRGSLASNSVIGCAASTPSAAGEGGGGRWRPQAVAVPDLALRVLGLAKQRALAIVGQHQGGARLGETGQIVKVAVVAKRKVIVPVARALGRRGNDGDAPLAQLGSKARAALGVDG